MNLEEIINRAVDTWSELLGFNQEENKNYKTLKGDAKSSKSGMKTARSPKKKKDSK